MHSQDILEIYIQKTHMFSRCSPIEGFYSCMSSMQHDWIINPDICLIKCFYEACIIYRPHAVHHVHIAIYYISYGFNDLVSI